MLARIATLLVAGVAVYLVLAIIFWVYCLLGGHNVMEMVYGKVLRKSFRENSPSKLLSLVLSV